MHITTLSPQELIGPLNEVEKANAPDVLYVAGDVSLFGSAPRVAIVGSRDATTLGRNRATKLTRALVKRGAVIVSGLAEGIDTVAHATAINEGGRTIGVIGTPLDKYFPAKNRELQDRIAREHALVSQFSHPGGAKNFPMRNRTMALLSNVTIIVEAGDKSGTMHQGWEALRLGRLLFLLDSLALKQYKWTEELRQYGAQVLTDANFSAFLDLIPERAHGEELAF